MEWRASPRQAAFLRCEADEVLYGGAAGGGKTDALLILPAIRCTQVPGAHVLYLRREFPDLEMSAIRRSQELFAGTGPIYNGAAHLWRWPNKSTLRFGHMQREDDAYGYKSAEFDLIIFDELTEFTEFQYLYMISRNRTSKPGVKPIVRAGSNPGGIGHAWVKRRFIDGARPNEVRRVGDRTRCFIPAKLADNPALMTADPGYLARLQELPEAERKALAEGDWDIFAGQYYPEWRREIHVVEPFAIPPEWQRFRSLDYGLDCTACYWWAVAPDRTEYVIRELYQPDLSLSDATKRIVELTPPDVRSKIRYTVASPDLWNRRQDSGVAGIETLIKHGLTGLIPADDRRIPGWRELREHLKPFDDPNVGRKRARLQIFDTCSELIRTLPALVRDQHKPEDVSDKSEDHGAESIRYGAMSRPMPAPKPEQYDNTLEGRVKQQLDELANRPKHAESYW